METTRQLQLLSYPLTHNPIKVDLLLNHVRHQSKPVDVDITRVHLDKMEHFSETFLAVNPNRKIPALIHANGTLWESNAILHFLANHFQSSLWPQDSATQSEVIRWFMWEGGRWSHVIGTLLKHRVYFPFWGYEGSEEEIAKSRKRLVLLLQILDQHLQHQTFLAGNEMTLADLSIAAPLMFASELALDLPDFPSLHLWLKSLSSTDWWQQSRNQLNEFMSVTA